MSIVHDPNRNSSLVPTGSSALDAMGSAVNDEHVRDGIRAKVHTAESHLSVGQWLHLSSSDLTNAVRQDFAQKAATEYDSEMAKCLGRLEELPAGVRSALSTSVFTGNCHEWVGRHDLGHLVSVHLTFPGLRNALAGVATIAPHSPDRIAVNAVLNADGHHYFVYLSSQGARGEKSMYLGIQEGHDWILEMAIPCPLEVAERAISSYEPAPEVVECGLTVSPLRRLATWVFSEIDNVLAS